MSTRSGTDRRMALLREKLDSEFQGVVKRWRRCVDKAKQETLLQQGLLVFKD